MSDKSPKVFPSNSPSLAGLPAPPSLEARAALSNPEEKEEPSQRVLIPASFAQNVQPGSLPNVCSNGFLICCGSIFGCIGAFIPGCCCCYPYKSVQQGYAGVLSRFGYVRKITDPGLYPVNPCVDSLVVVDVRVRIMNVPRQSLMTRDNITVSIETILYWYVVDPLVAICRVKNVSFLLSERAQTTMRDTVGTLSLQTIIQDRNAVGDKAKKIIDQAAQGWGIKIQAITIKDLKFSSNLIASLSSAVKQEREGQGKLVAAKAGVETAKKLREASDILDTPMAMQMKHLDTLSEMAKTRGSTLVFAPEGYEPVADMTANVAELEAMMVAKSGMQPRNSLVRGPRKIMFI